MSGINYETMKQEAKEADLQLLAKEMYEAWKNKHKELWPHLYVIDNHPVLPPIWEEMDDKVKQCWLAAAKCAMDEYIS